MKKKKLQKVEFIITNDEYIELNKLMKINQLAETGGMANILITQGEVKVNGEVELQKRKKIRPGDKVEFEGILIEVKK